MSKIVAVVCLLFSLHAQALEVDGVRLDERVQVAGQPLVLNGAGVRTFLFMDVYVAALYLPSRQTSDEAALAEPGVRRIELHVLRDVPASRVLAAFRKGMVRNNSEQSLAVLAPRVAAFEHLFQGMGEMAARSVIAFDGVPGEGLRASIDGKELGRVAGDDFYRALLSIWLGAHPAQVDLKKGLLGG
ncbi:chalcone isomerase family protein [Ferriphaselus sp. R-1]|uniref:chalcone isomerase family protein n=1 Tax=Ferriphaselus sp. R-1 TaxID=1485544 RepID=UPI0005554563|nr:chalcone isomerase family protein [Ferriphaselus sp. R-1]